MNEQEIVLFIESKDGAVCGGPPNNQYRLRALQLLNCFVYQEDSHRGDEEKPN
ncbi:MAG: hypothetical protein LBQ38_08530 [Spirochaetaceae bacterium]|nr:hypothetical protein [Spirochaetaceae bacterium]